MQYKKLRCNAYFLFALSISGICLSAPKELEQGLIEFELARGNFVEALSLLKDVNGSSAVDLAYANQALGTTEFDQHFKQASQLKLKQLSDYEKFRMALIYYNQSDCISALKYLKGKTRKLSESSLQQRTYLKAHCLLELDKGAFAAKALSDNLQGEWIANAYYNLAMHYAAKSSNKSRALVALRVARDINVDNTSKAEIGPSAKELTSRINLAAGKLYLDAQKYDIAVDFFDKLPVNSMYAPQALFLKGKALIEQRDFRAATQAWRSNNKYPLAVSGVAESYLAIPFAFEQAGYITQALESYVSASALFKEEMDAIDKLIDLVRTKGVDEAILTGNEDGQALHFLADKAKSAHNTKRAGYYGHLVRQPEMYALIEQYQDMKAIDLRLKSDVIRLHVLISELERAGVKRTKIKLNEKRLQEKLKGIQSRYTKVAKSLSGDSTTATTDSFKQVEERISTLASRKKDGLSGLKQQIKSLKKLIKRGLKQSESSAKFLNKFHRLVGERSIAELLALKEHYNLFYERSELGLVHILEERARARTKRTNLLDGRYQ